MFKSTCVPAAGLLVGLTLIACNSKENTKGVVEGYQPEKPIEFSHEIHAGKNKIDCKYCHNSNSGDTSTTTAELCMNCHKVVKGRLNKEK